MFNMATSGFVATSIQWMALDGGVAGPTAGSSRTDGTGIQGTVRYNGFRVDGTSPKML